MIKIGFHGAARTVTGSKHLIELSGGEKILLDCGMFQGMGGQTGELNGHWGFDPQSLDHVILSHAHIDHLGLLPKLVKDGYKGRIYCTPATASLAKLLLLDSARIQEADVRYVNKRRIREGKAPVEPLYREEDAAAVFPLMETIPYGERFAIAKGVELLFTDAGHIIGSAAVHLAVKHTNTTTRISFSGDLGRYRDMILRSPAIFPAADHIILESTYGNRLHDAPAVATDKLLAHILKTCVAQKGKLIIPAFSLGRTQEILYMLNRLELDGRLPAVTCYVDSPLSVGITELVKKYPDHFNASVQELLRQDQDVFSFRGLRYIEEAADSKALNDKQEPCIIISSSGMAEAGRVKHHIANTVSDKRNTILFTGYCEPASLGGRLKTRPPEVMIFGKRYAVHASVDEISSLSAHGDYEDMLEWLSSQDPVQVKEIYLVHGEYSVQQEFRKRLVSKGFGRVSIPDLHETIRLEDTKF